MKVYHKKTTRKPTERKNRARYKHQILLKEKNNTKSNSQNEK